MRALRGRSRIDRFDTDIVVSHLQNIDGGGGVFAVHLALEWAETPRERILERRRLK